MPIAWRIVKPYRVAEAFFGEGARLYGGRWNPIGTAMVYAAESKSLAALEILVHVDVAELLDNYLCIPIRFDGQLVRTLGFSALPNNWRDPLLPSSTQEMGLAWVKDELSAVLKVPSVLVPGESNYLINPNHPNFGKLNIGGPEPFEFDPRLLK